MKLIRTSLAARMVLALLMAGLVPLGSRLMEPFAAEAQNLGQRAVMGAVVDANSTPVAGATVFLRDLKSKNIRSFTSVEHGRFRFAQVNIAEDHELGGKGRQEERGQEHQPLGCAQGDRGGSEAEVGGRDARSLPF